MVEAYIFDFDGVIADTENRRFLKIQELLWQKGIKVADEYKPRTNGRTTRDILFEDFTGQLSLATIDQILAQYQVEFKSHVHEFAEPISPTIEFLRGYQGHAKLGLASMSPRESVTQILHKFGLEKRFDQICTREAVNKNKPNPEIYLLAAEKLRVKPTTCVAIEDTPVGASAAIAAGMRCYILMNGHNDKQGFSDIATSGFIESLSDFAATGI